MPKALVPGLGGMEEIVVVDAEGADESLPHAGKAIAVFLRRIAFGEAFKRCHQVC